jgi:type IV pilus assembly protein PilV
MKAKRFVHRSAHRFNSGRRQRGILLIEALCAILIFSFGVLGMIGLQTSAASQSGDAKMRSAAAELADEYIGVMWVTNRTPAVLQPGFSSPAGASYVAWLAGVTAALPGAVANPPAVVITPEPVGCAGAACTSSRVSITVNWQAPHDNVLHQYTVIAQISGY